MVAIKKTQRESNDTPVVDFSPALKHTLLERIGEAGILILDQAGNILFASQRAGQVFACKPENLIQKNYFEHLKFCNEHGLTLVKTHNPAWGALHTQQYTQITPFFTWLNLSAEHNKPIVIKATQVVDANQVFAVIEVREAKRSMQVDEMKTLFISFAAHQLKTPSSIVKGFIELLLREGRKAFSANQWSHLESAYEANENLIRLSKNLLNITKLEGGLIEPAISHFDAREIVFAKIASQKLLLSIKNINVDVRGPQRVGFESDSVFFAEVFEILFSNAIKYSPEDSQIIISIIPSDASLKVIVDDAGPGVLPDQIPHLFSAFNVSHTHTNSHGMGLLMAKKYLDLLGGQIGYERSQAGGSSFYFVIPKRVY